MDNIQKILTDAIQSLIDNSLKESKIEHLQKKHDVKVHFIPYRYRVFNGLLQSMNIQFGNFIEKAMHEILKGNSKLEIITKYSGVKSNKFYLSRASETLIDNYITDCQINNYSEQQLLSAYSSLVQQIGVNERNDKLPVVEFKHDIDVLFREKATGVYYYTEIKYNDDHDTGKFVDINRKLLKTYAYLVREFGANAVKPILFYFTNKKMKGNIYIPENEVIYRGERFFDRFTNIKYEDVDGYMRNISEDEKTKKIFDDLYTKIVRS
ncbi:MAG: hypothetical protein LBM01_02765 [Christensenellaceae bacterium]|nr:hypothetical protein [Christensenellaceae bacterium]